ncbi:MAG: hypothetical protein EBS39_03805 [Gammaproteobacteria bacterium]|nr:hypothetical protein [Gammaproteobacteria bacterium]
MRRMPTLSTTAAVCRLLTFGLASMASLTATAGPAATQLPVATLTSPLAAAAPVDNAAFAPGADAAEAAPLVGTLRIDQASMRALPELKGPVIGGRDARLFPALSLQLFSDGGRLVPVQRGTMLGETPVATARGARSYWTVIPQFGRVWREPGDGDWSRAALPLMLVNDTENHAHQGVVTFLYRGGEVTALRLQFTQQTAPYLLHQHFVLWGRATAGFTAGGLPDLEAQRAAARRELAGRLPAKPWSELAKQFPAGTLDGFGGPLRPKWQVLNALVYRGTLYHQDSSTPYGPYPYPLEMRFGVRSVMKSVAAPLALLRLAETYGPYVLDLRIGDHVPGLHPKWSRVRFIDAADMSTGFGGFGSLKTRPNDPFSGYLEGEYDAWYTAGSTAAKLALINRHLKPYPWEPGTVMRYRDQDFFLLGLAIDGFLKSVRGPQADLWQMLGDEVFKPIGIHHAPAVRTLEAGGARGVVWANAGYYPTLDDLAKIALLLQSGGAHDGQQLLHRGLTADLLAARGAFDIRTDRSRDTGDAAAGAGTASGDEHYHMGYWFPRHVGSASGKAFLLPSMQGSGDNRVTIYPNGIISLQMAKAAELPPGEQARDDDAAATHRVVDRMAPF